MPISPADLLPCLAESGQPAPLFDALDRAFQQLIGHQLFTLFAVDGQEVSRLHSTRPEQYPVGGRKLMGPTPWGDLVLTRQQPFLGRDRAAIRWAYFDHALIESMGLGCAINVPMIYDGQAIGALSLLDAEYRYTDEHLAKILPFAPLAIPAFLQAHRSN